MWGILAFLGGLAYGYFVKGPTDKTDLFKRAMLWAVVAAVVLVLLGILTGTNPLGVRGLGWIGFLISALVIVLLFVLGAWLGDWLEHRRSPARA